MFLNVGYSHKPEEYASIEDIANGVNVLALTLAQLSLEWALDGNPGEQVALAEWCCAMSNSYVWMIFFSNYKNKKNGKKNLQCVIYIGGLHDSEKLFFSAH